MSDVLNAITRQADPAAKVADPVTRAADAATRVAGPTARTADPAARAADLTAGDTMCERLRSPTWLEDVTTSLIRGYEHSMSKTDAV
jgi:hypothetical protein